MGRIKIAVFWPESDFLSKIIDFPPKSDENLRIHRFFSVVSSPNPYTDSPLSDENLHKLAQDLSKFSRKLAKLLGVDDAKVQKSMTNSEEKEFCFRILKEWAEKNSRSGRSLLNLLIGDLDLIEVAQVTMKVLKLCNLTEINYNYFQKIHESNA